MTKLPNDVFLRMCLYHEVTCDCVEKNRIYRVWCPPLLLESTGGLETYSPYMRGRTTEIRLKFQPSSVRLHVASRAVWRFTSTGRCRVDLCGNGIHNFDIRLPYANQLNETWNMAVFKGLLVEFKFNTAEE